MVPTSPQEGTGRFPLAATPPRTDSLTAPARPLPLIRDGVRQALAHAQDIEFERQFAAQFEAVFLQRSSTEAESGA
jgi:hypothetical protein